MSDLSVAYYGYLFDASGYGHAARGYVHALHAAGVDISAVEIGRRERQVADPLVESLVARRGGADIHLFHGIPTEWARHAFRLRNAVGMTVWETDAMPTQWRNALSHVRELWLPCQYNVDVFQAELLTPVFKLPHVLHGEAGAREALGALPSSISQSDFVIYSIFEWQDRKHPLGMLDAFLRAFPREDENILVLKTNPGAATAAHQALADVRRRTHSAGRVSLHPESWPQATLRALQQRGDCYLSLHRGEGWGYPLFEAAARGTPVVATGYSGPLEYLREGEHGLVRWSRAPVHQPYVHYHPRMHWADPDLDHAVTLLREVRQGLAAARVAAARGAQRLRASYAPGVVGALARDRLLELRDRLAHRSARHSGLAIVTDSSVAPIASPTASTATTAGDARPGVPIPGDWYDADYFEHGTKSNWAHGYHWPRFAGLFRDTAAFLVDLFPNARSFLDAGCAKGFLVRALRERGRDCDGFDCSTWAIEHGEPLARPFMTRADAGEYEFGAEYDVVVALDLFSHLTESQASAFLRRARDRTRIGIVATIATPTSPSADGRDRTHVTCHDRAWWTEHFRGCGWRQDPMHAALETVARRQALPSRMGWELYLFSPGERASSAVVSREAIA